MKELELFVYGEISPWLNSAKEVAEALQKNKDAKSVLVRINSPGGAVSEGFAIYDLLKSSGKKIKTLVEGRCASIATVVFLAGEEREMTENSTFMIHNPWGYSEGDADQIRKYADTLDKVEEFIVNFYHEKTGIDKEELDKLMKKETDYNAEEALEMGFATNVIETVLAKAIIKFENKENMKTNEQPKNKKGSLMSRLSNIVKALSPEEVKNLDMTLEDGTAIEIETEADAPAIGDMVTTGGNPVEDGQHTLDNGMIITTENGAITEIQEPASGKEDDEDKFASAIEASVTKALKPVTDQLKALQAQQEAQAAEQEEIVNSIELIGQNLSSDGFKHKARQKSSAQGSKKELSDEEVKANSIKARRKAEGLIKEEN